MLTKIGIAVTSITFKGSRSREVSSGLGLSASVSQSETFTRAVTCAIGISSAVISTTQTYRKMGLMIHTCTIRAFILDTINSYGEYTQTTKVDEMNVPCRFYTHSGYTTRAGQAQLTTSDFKILLPKNTIVSEGNLITGISGFTGTYTVRKVFPRYDGNGLHHYECDIEGET